MNNREFQSHVWALMGRLEYALRDGKKTLTTTVNGCTYTCTNIPKAIVRLRCIRLFRYGTDKAIDPWEYKNRFTI
jgi:hypothetical protein